ncbi:MAG: T9SS type A sorting domain-containing protein [Flavobacteriales bacterium]|nr:T9SS type A sorting domain-containing protein [Flavobacteriales bacterium]
MKQLYTLLFSILSVFSTQAQITIGQAEMPHANDELVRVRAVTNPLVNYAATGPAHTWDYSNLAANAGDTTNYQTVASTNFIYAIVYADIFFNANRANHAKQGVDIPFSNLLPIDNPYTFRYHSNSVYKTVGYGVELSGIPLPLIFDQHDVIYQLPLAYGNTSASHSSYHIDIPNIGYYGFEQDRDNVVDGWGAITTPGGVFDVIRVKTTLTMHDTITGFAIDRPVVREYKWLAQGLRVPVLQINTTTVFGTEIVNAIYYYDVPRTIEVVAPLASTICPGAAVPVHYEATGAFNAGGFFVPANHFTAQLSDASGSFASPANIGDVTATTSGIINATIPANTPPGSGYRIRVISTSPGFTGTSNAFNITIGGATAASISASGPSLICTGETLTLTAVGGPSYQWQLNGTDIGGATSDTYDAAQAGAYTVLVDNACGSATSNSIVVEVNEPPTHAVDETAYLICAGASVMVTAHDQSGQLPLSYQWMLNNAPIVGATDSVVTATLGGIYTVEVINGTTGCNFITEDVVVSVQSVPAPEVSALDTTSFCAGGSVQLSAANVPAGTFQWFLDGSVIPNETTTELTADASGDYTIIATSTDGCSSAPSAAITVTVNALPETPDATAVGATSFCDGGSVELNVPAALGNTYQWYLDGNAISGGTDTALVAMASGEYSIVTTDSVGCSSEASATISVIAESLNAPGVTSTEPTTFCEGGGTMLIADAIDDAAYQWWLDGLEINGATINQLTVTTAGAYTVTVTSLIGCSATSDPAIDVVVNPLPPQPLITLSNDSLLVSEAGTFQWFIGGVSIPGATDPWWVPSVDGTYTVQFTDANGCSSLSEGWLYLSTRVTGLSAPNLLVLPNPSNGIFSIQLRGGHGQAYEVLDATGQLVRSGRLAGARTSVDMGQAEQGMYFLRIRDNDSAPVLRILITR